MGEPDLNAVSKIVLNDWNRGKLPFFVPPPGCSFEPKPDTIEDEPVSESEAEEVESENEEVDDDTNVEDSINESVVEPEDTQQQAPNPKLTFVIMLNKNSKELLHHLIILMKTN